MRFKRPCIWKRTQTLINFVSWPAQIVVQYPSFCWDDKNRHWKCSSDFVWNLHHEETWIIHQDNALSHQWRLSGQCTPSRVGSSTVFARRRPLWLLCISKGQTGAENRKLSEHGLGQSKSGADSQQADRKGIPARLCTVKNLDDVEQESSGGGGYTEGYKVSSVISDENKLYYISVVIY